ncbi:MAG: hypothetical protein JWQ96_1851 [Segetibacter sp.]|nr:hypothetical protein [Segetibacter sp.]
MAKCNFKFSFSQPIEHLLTQAKQQIEGQGGSFVGDSTSGSFIGSTPLGSLKASYTVAGQEIFISIDKKPLLVSCGKIERVLADNFKNV